MGEMRLIDRKKAVEYFNNMFQDKQVVRILSITGAEKMGKSRLLREYRYIGKENLRAQCAIIDLRSKLQDFADILYNIAQQIGIGYFPKFISTYNDLSTDPRVDVSRITQFFSFLQISNDEKKSAQEVQRRQLTSAFVQDLQLMPSNIPYVFLFDAFEEASIHIKDWIYDQLICGLIHLPNTFFVIAGRTLPDPSVIWQDFCGKFELTSVSVEDLILYCASNQIDLSEEVIQKFHEAFDGKPGLFAEYTSKFKL